MKLRFAPLRSDLGSFACEEPSYQPHLADELGICDELWMQENENIEIKPRRKRRSLEQIGELVREFGSSGLTQRNF